MVSLIFRVGGTVWFVLSAVWSLCFLAVYLIYLPLRYRRFSYGVKREQLLVRSGVFYNRTRTMPLGSIQFTGVTTSPFDVRWKLSTLVVTAPGGRIVIPGLSRKDASSLADLLTEAAGR